MSLGVFLLPSSKISVLMYAAFLTVKFSKKKKKKNFKSIPCLRELGGNELILD